MIFIFNGPPGTGKDEGCLFLKGLGYKHLSFKEQLIIETCKLFEVSENWFMAGYEDRTLKEKKTIYLQGLSRREALIHTSENIIKPKFGSGFFGEKLSEKIDREGVYCVSDGGFIEEIIPIINKIGTENIIIIQLTRDGYDFSIDSRKYFNFNLVEEYILGNSTPINPSEVIDKYLPIKTYRVHNNKTVTEFHSVLKNIHEKENNARKINKKKGGFEKGIL